MSILNYLAPLQNSSWPRLYQLPNIIVSYVIPDALNSRRIVWKVCFLNDIDKWHIYEPDTRKRGYCAVLRTNAKSSHGSWLWHPVVWCLYDEIVIKPWDVIHVEC